MSKSMELTILLGVLASFAGALGWWRWRGKAGASQQERGEALKTCRLLLGLLKLIQQHRGLASGWLAGDGAFLGRMAERRREVDQLLPRLVQAVAQEEGHARPCVTTQGFKLFRFRWREVVEGLPQASVEQSIAQHSMLVGELLEWLSALGEARIELAQDTDLPQGLVRNFAHRLPALSEYLGQARAIGSSVAARKGCSPVARVRLMFLIARAEALLTQALERGGSLGLGHPAAEGARRAVAEMAQVVRSQMLMSAGVTVSSDDFFRIATAAIDGVFAWVDACAQELERCLAVPPAPSHRRLATGPA